MNLKEAATLLGISRERTTKLIKTGIKLQDSSDLKISAQPKGTNDYDIDDKMLDVFLKKLESQEPGRWPPVAVRRELLIEVGYKCAICRSDAPLQFQHIIEWSEIKHHDTRHMMAICGVCHDKITRHGEPDTTAQYKIKEKYLNREITGENDSGKRKIAITDPLLTCDDEIVDSQERPRVLWLLPRGFIMLDNITWQECSSWSITADYYQYGEGWRHATHYHDSYGRNWHNNLQYQKLGIPIGDWKYCHSAFEMMRSLREKRRDDMEAYVNKRSANGEPVIYMPSGTSIIPAKIDRERGRENVYPLNHDVRDLCAEFDTYRFTDLDRDKELLRKAHDDVATLRMRSIMLLIQILGKSHPAINLFRETMDEYHSEMVGQELCDWMRKTKQVFLEASDWTG